MKFQLEFNPKTLSIPIKTADNLFCIGSCFAENIAKKLELFQFNITQNPNNIQLKESNLYLVNDELSKISMAKPYGSSTTSDIIIRA